MDTYSNQINVISWSSQTKCHISKTATFYFSIHLVCRDSKHKLLTVLTGAEGGKTKGKPKITWKESDDRNISRLKEDKTGWIKWKRLRYVQG